MVHQNRPGFISNVGSATRLREQRGPASHATAECQYWFKARTGEVHQVLSRSRDVE